MSGVLNHTVPENQAGELYLIIKASQSEDARRGVNMLNKQEKPSHGVLGDNTPVGYTVLTEQHHDIHLNLPLQ